MRSVQVACALPMLLLACAACSLSPGGARLSTRVHGTVIVRLLAAALAIVALRLAAQGLLGI